MMNFDAVEGWLAAHVYMAYLLPLAVLWSWYVIRQRQVHARAIEIRDENLALGLDQPASLHPVIDPSICIGCGACVTACPEKNVLGLIGGKAELISPANCIGHGACEKACPVGGIDLVFGTAKRGIDIPSVNTAFESSRPGIFIAGELGGMGLVRNAIEQGKQAVDNICQAIAQSDGPSSPSALDLIIVGAGPAGIASALAAKAQGLRYLVIEQDSLGGTVAHFPRKKLVMTAPVDLPLVGKMNFRETSKEDLLGFWKDIVSRQSLEIRFQERLEGLQDTDNGFTVQTSQGSYETQSILLCLGRRGSPRKLDVPGEDSSKVVYRLDDPRVYRQQHVLVVGGGDSALEAAVSLAEEGACVTLSYRSESFSRAKPKNRASIEDAAKRGIVRLELGSTVALIESAAVLLDTAQGRIQLDNDAIIVCVGGILPSGFLQKMGIVVETKYGTR